MSRPGARLIRLVKVLVVVGLVVWGVIAWWTIRQARQTGSVLRDSLTAVWPEQGSPQFGNNFSYPGSVRLLGFLGFLGMQVELRGKDGMYQP